MIDRLRLEQALSPRFNQHAHYVALAIVILLLASAVRFHRLGAQSLWYDEGVAYAHSLRTLPELIPLLQNNVHVPAYFTLLGWWQDLTGSSEFALRLLSALFSILGVAWTYALGARLFHPFAGLAAAALVALNSFSIYYAQEARMYAMLSAVAAASMWLFVGLLRRRSSNADDGGGRGQLIGLGLVNALGMYTHVAYALVILTQVALAALSCCAALLRSGLAERSRRLNWARWLGVLLPFVITFILFLPWLSVAVSQLSAQPNLSQPLPLAETTRQILGFFAFGRAFEVSTGNLPFVVWLFLLFGLIPAARRNARWNMTLPLAWAVISVVAYLYLGLTDRYLRFLLPAQLAFALLLGRGFWLVWTLKPSERRFPLRAIPKLAAAFGIAVYLLALLGGLDTLYHHHELQRDDVRGLTARIESELREGDAVLVSAAGFGEVLDYYYRGEAPVYGLPMSAEARDTASRVHQITQTHSRIFAIFYGSEEQDPERAVESNLNAHSYQASQEWVGDMRFARYIAPADDSFDDEILAPDLLFGENIRLAHYWSSAQPVARGDYLLVGIFWLATDTPPTRYKVFLQLLDAEGKLVAQRDSEPAGGIKPTTSWQAGFSYKDLHALLIPEDLPAGEYTLIAGLYDINDASARLPVGEGAYVELKKVKVVGAS